MWSTPRYTDKRKTDSRCVISGKDSESSVLENAGPINWKENDWSFFSFCHGFIFAFLSTPYYLISEGTKGATACSY